MKKIIIIIILLAGAGGGYWYWKKSKAVEAPKFEVVTVTRGDVQIKSLATGTVQPQNRLELNTPVAGRLEEVLVREGDLVKRGQILAWVSSSERASMLDAARARGPEELAKWEQIYKPTPLIAPLDGEIIARKLEPGQSVGNELPILIMSDRLIVEAQVDETDIARIQVGQTSRVQLDAYPEVILDATVSHIAYEAEEANNVTVYNIEILPAKIPDFLRSGMSASVTFLGQAATNVLLLPSSAVQHNGREATVMFPGDEAAGIPPEPKTIETGLDDGLLIEIKSGLSEGDQVLESSFALQSNEGSKGSPLVPMPGRGRRRL